MELLATVPSRYPRSARSGRVGCWPASAVPAVAGLRGQPPADLDAVTAAITGLSQLAAELGDVLEALDINPLICGPAGAVAVDALAIPRQGTPAPPGRLDQPR